MLPILRIVPVGGVLFAILILILALTPPGGSHTSVSPAIRSARGPLIDRDEHPEWRQMLIHAALRRADELGRLRELPDTPVVVAPVTPPPSELPGDPPNETIIETITDIVTPVPDEPAKATETEPAAEPAGEVATEPAAEPAVELAQPEAAPPAAAETADAATQTRGTPHSESVPDLAPKDVTGSIKASPEATIPIEGDAIPPKDVAVVVPDDKPVAVRAPKPAKVSPQVRHTRRVRRTVVFTQPTPGLFELMFSITPTEQTPTLSVPATAAQRTAQRTVMPMIPLYPQLRGDIN